MGIRIIISLLIAFMTLGCSTRKVSLDKSSEKVEIKTEENKDIKIENKESEISKETAKEHVDIKESDTEHTIIKEYGVTNDGVTYLKKEIIKNKKKVKVDNTKKEFSAISEIEKTSKIDAKEINTLDSSVVKKDKIKTVETKRNYLWLLLLIPIGFFLANQFYKRNT